MEKTTKDELGTGELLIAGEDAGVIKSSTETGETPDVLLGRVENTKRDELGSVDLLVSCEEAELEIDLLISCVEGELGMDSSKLVELGFWDNSAAGNSTSPKSVEFEQVPKLSVMNGLFA